MALTKIDDRGLKTPIDLLDNEKIRLGTGNDLQLYHEGNHSYIQDAGTGSLILVGNNVTLQNAAQSENMFSATQDGSVDLYYNGSKKFETTNVGATFSGNAFFPDNYGCQFGNAAGSSDLLMYHDGSNSYLKENGTGGLYVQSNGNGIFLQKSDGEQIANFVTDGAVELYYDNSKKFETTSAGIEVTGNAKFPDNGTIQLGAGNDLSISHNGTDSQISSATNSLRIRSDAFKVMNYNNNEALIYANADAGVELFFDGTAKLETRSGDTLFHDDIRIQDNNKINIGTLDDLQLYHDGSHSYIKNGTGNLNLRTGGTLWIDNASGNETYIKAIENGAVELYYDNTKKFETTSNGFQAHGTEFKFTDAADIDVIINADTDNSDESHNPRLVFKQDGATNCLAIGVEGSAGTAFTNSTGNWGYIEALDGHGGLGMEFATNGTRRMYITLGGTINGDFNDTSDGNLKENIVSISSTIDKVKTLRPVTFDWKDKTKEKNYSGFIAQEVKAIYPNLVTGEEHTTEEPWKNYSLNTNGLVAYLTKALQEAITKIETLETKVAALEAA